MLEVARSVVRAVAFSPGCPQHPQKFSGPPVKTFSASQGPPGPSLPPAPPPHLHPPGCPDVWGSFWGLSWTVFVADQPVAYPAQGMLVLLQFQLLHAVLQLPGQPVLLLQGGEARGHREEQPQLADHSHNWWGPGIISATKRKLQDIPRRVLAKPALLVEVKITQIHVLFFMVTRGVRDAAYRPRYIALLDISSTPRAARDAVYWPRYIAPLEYSSTPNGDSLVLFHLPEGKRQSRACILLSTSYRGFFLLEPPKFSK